MVHVTLLLITLLDVPVHTLEWIGSIHNPQIIRSGRIESHLSRAKLPALNIIRPSVETSTQL